MSSLCGRETEAEVQCFESLEKKMCSCTARERPGQSLFPPTSGWHGVFLLFAVADPLCQSSFVVLPQDSEEW